MLISSKAKLVPVMTSTSTRLYPYFRVYSETDRLYVAHTESDPDGNFGSCKYSDPDEQRIKLTNSDNIKKAARKLLEVRPKATASYPVSVIFLKSDSVDCTEIKWVPVDIKGNAMPFDGMDSFPIPQTEGESYCKNSVYKVYYSPVSAINTVVDYLTNCIGRMVELAKQTEDQEALDIATAKPLLERIIKAQEI
jgi:hypothetical protein